MLQKSEWPLPDFRILFRCVPGSPLLMLADDPVFTVVAVSDDSAEDSVGRGIFESFAGGPDDLRASLKRVMETRLSDRIATRKGSLLNTPVLQADGNVGHILHTVDEQDAETDLRQQWHTFDVALSHTPDLAYILDRNGRFTYANRALLSLWQKPLAEALGKNFWDLDYPPELAERLHRQIQEVFDTKATVRDRANYAGADREARDYEYIFVPVCSADGQVEAVVGSTRDITEQKKAEALAAQDRRRWRDLLLQAPAGIAVLRGAEHRFESVNADYLRLIGRSAQDIIGRTVLEALPEVEGQIYEGLLNGVFRTGEPFFGHELLLRLARADGTLEDVYVNFVYLATRNAGGEIDGIFVHVIDVTDMVVSRKRVEESEERFRQLADSMPQMVWTARPDGNHDYYNERWYAFSGRERDAVGNEGWTSMLHPDDAQRTYKTWRRSVETGVPFQIESRFWDGQESRWRWFMGRAAAVRDGAGHIVKWFGTFTDIDEQKSTQQAVLHAQKLESVGLLAGGIAHDFNNLLVGILGGASFALETIPSSDPAYSMLQGVMDASERAAHLTRQMLAYAGKGAFVIEAIDLSDTVTYTVELIRASIPKLVRIDLKLTEGLPMVQTDAGQMQQVAMNLILNGAEAVGDKDGSVTVRTRAEEIARSDRRREVNGNEIAPGLYAVLEVQDTGSGIDGPTLVKIFDPFFTTKFTGRGLGLAAVAGIVRSHQGVIEVETAVGSGSTFRVLLPANYTRELRQAITPEAEKTSSGVETVLIVDDEPVVRRVAKAALERSGYRAIATESGDQALLLIEQNPDISLVLLDMSMPGMSGRQVLEALKTMRPALPVVICSGFSEEEVYRQFSGLEVAGVLQKPFTVKRLTAKARSVLDWVKGKS